MPNDVQHRRYRVEVRALSGEWLLCREPSRSGFQSPLEFDAAERALSRAEEFARSKSPDDLVRAVDAVRGVVLAGFVRKPGGTVETLTPERLALRVWKFERDRRARSVAREPEDVARLEVGADDGTVGGWRVRVNPDAEAPAEWVRLDVLVAAWRVAENKRRDDREWREYVRTAEERS